MLVIQGGRENRFDGRHSLDAISDIATMRGVDLKAQWAPELDHALCDAQGRTVEGDRIILEWLRRHLKVRQGESR